MLISCSLFSFSIHFIINYDQKVNNNVRLHNKQHNIYEKNQNKKELKEFIEFITGITRIFVISLGYN